VGTKQRIFACVEERESKREMLMNINNQPSDLPVSTPGAVSPATQDLGQPTSADAAPAEAPLMLLVKGFNPMELRLLMGTVMLSRRRHPRIELVGDECSKNADAIMIDAADPQARAWADGQDWLKHKTVIWVDSAAVPHGHTQIKRPVQWPALPMLLARALEHGPDSQPAAAPTPRTSTTRAPVLVIDDSLAVRAYLRSLLEPRGFVLTEADSAEVGIAAAASARYACILMDVLMPGMDGYEACRRIKARARSGEGPAIVMLTSKSSPFDRIRGKMAGCDAYLTKPINPNDLYEVVLRYASMTNATPSPAPSPAQPWFHLST
jgi:two-component system cell cycle response regulator